MNQTANSPAEGGTPWWKDAVFYQIYPASFKDSNNDGWGDIPGIISKLDHLSYLGVDVIWLSPIYESPQKDMGYDVSDYQAVYSRYGTLEDMDDLISACHSRGLKIILDLVINHTSDQHPWFLESRASRSNPKRDWYIWKPARRCPRTGDRLPPTNWRGYFASSTWTWDPRTEEYYLHLYHPSQPDLNWDNPACRAAIYSTAIEFWLDRGVDGFRVDTVNKYSKDPSFADAPVTVPNSPIQPAPEMWCNGPRIHSFLHEMRTSVFDKYSSKSSSRSSNHRRGGEEAAAEAEADADAIVTVGELSHTPSPAQVLPYVSAARRELDMAHEFSLIRLGTGQNIFEGKYDHHPFSLPTLKRLVGRWQTWVEGTDGWNTVFVENHDNGRAVSRFGDDGTGTGTGTRSPGTRSSSGSGDDGSGDGSSSSNSSTGGGATSWTADLSVWQASAKCLALWQATLTGTLFLYQGQEIGMSNMPAGWPIEDEYKDVETREFYREAVASGDQNRIRRTAEGLRILARDHARLPMQWDGNPDTHAGFMETNKAGGVGEERRPRPRPWMRVHDGFGRVNVQKQKGDEGSVLEFYRMVLKLRREHGDLFVHGRFRLLDADDESLFVYVKESNKIIVGDKNERKRKAVVVLNFTRSDRNLPDIADALQLDGGNGRLLVSTLGTDVISQSLKPWEGRVYLNF